MRSPEVKLNDLLREGIRAVITGGHPISVAAGLSNMINSGEKTKNITNQSTEIPLVSNQTPKTK